MYLNTLSTLNNLIAILCRFIQRKNDQEIKKCFDFWRDIPIIKEFDSEIYNQVIAATPRMDILDILVEGIEEEYPIGKNHVNSFAVLYQQQKYLIG